MKSLKSFQQSEYKFWSLFKCLFICIGSLGEDFDGYQLMKMVLVNRHSLCMVKDKLAFHLVIHWITAWKLWDLVLVLFDLQWVFPRSIGLLLLGWNETRMQKQRKRMWNLALFACFSVNGRNVTAEFSWRGASRSECQKTVSWKLFMNGLRSLGGWTFPYGFVEGLVQV